MKTIKSSLTYFIVTVITCLSKSKNQILVLISLYTSTHTIAQENKVLDSIIEANKYVFTIKNNELIGEKAKEFMLNTAENSQFFLIGELHFYQETPLFTKAILRLLKTIGYNNYGVEIGPNSQKKITELMSQRSGLDSIAKFYKEYGLEGKYNPIPFFDVFDEVETLDTAIKNNYQIWGIDQEFYDAPIFLFDDIYKLASLKANSQENYKLTYLKAKKKWIELNQDTTDYKYQNIINSKVINNFYKLSSKYSEEAKNKIKLIKESLNIFDFNARHVGYESLHGRANLMRKYFYQYYNKAKTENDFPKAIIKLGSMHTTRGRSPNYVYDIGNAIAEFAKQNNSESFNISIAGRNIIRSNGEIIDRLEFTPGYKALYKHEVPNKFTLIDLRAIKKAAFNRVFRLNLEKDKDFLELLMTYDAVLLTTLHKATRRTLDFNSSEEN